MLGLISAWLGLVALLISATMLLYRPAFTDVLVTLNLWLLAPLSMTCAGLVLWATRKDKSANAPVRMQASVGATLSVFAVIIVYALIHFAQQLGAS